MPPKFLLLYCIWIFTVTSTFFVRSQNNSASNICIYSKDPDQYQPKCFLCPNMLYPQILQTCTNGSFTMPSNITYVQANCFEQNCAINYPTPVQQEYRLFEENNMKQFEMLVKLIKTFNKRSVSDAGDKLKDMQSWKSEDKNDDQFLLQLKSINLSDTNPDIFVTQCVETYASEMGLEYEDY